MEKFALSGDYIELNKLLKASGLCDTGGIAKYAIKNGRVAVDGEVEYRKGCKIRHGQKVEFDSHMIEVN
ncbi:MAG: RNA-binding S4 domain-containing protein [Syntrophales bacterium]|nr:RNA-binding S4 domain-containing protein [Syntrophales bacterium]MCK9392022.1 RNA-binding S4 domain-containing protein [Syntrophales bacterium]MCX5830035.1 RNA-binding S4 domain-containing protein [Deltaproteobacteria bacterium]